MAYRADEPVQETMHYPRWSGQRRGRAIALVHQAMASYASNLYARHGDRMDAAGITDEDVLHCAMEHFVRGR